LASSFTVPLAPVTETGKSLAAAFAAKKRETASVRTSAPSFLPVTI
jgi:hypothetical protein